MHIRGRLTGLSEVALSLCQYACEIPLACKVKGTVLKWCLSVYRWRIHYSTDINEH